MRFRENYPDHNMEFQYVNTGSDLHASFFFKEGLKETQILTAVSFGEV